MIKPTTKELMKKVDSTYTLCNAVGKRARQLIEGACPLAGDKFAKPVSIAAEEISEGKIIYIRDKDVIKKKRDMETSIFESCR